MAKGTISNIFGVTPRILKIAAANTTENDYTVGVDYGVVWRSNDEGTEYWHGLARLGEESEFFLFEYLQTNVTDGTLDIDSETLNEDHLATLNVGNLRSTLNVSAENDVLGNVVRAREAVYVENAPVGPTASLTLTADSDGGARQIDFSSDLGVLWRFLANEYGSDTNDFHILRPGIGDGKIMRFPYEEGAAIEVSRPLAISAPEGELKELLFVNDDGEMLWKIASTAIDALTVTDGTGQQIVIPQGSGPITFSRDLYTEGNVNAPDGNISGYGILAGIGGVTVSTVGGTADRFITINGGDVGDKLIEFNTETLGTWTLKAESITNNFVLGHSSEDPILTVQRGADDPIISTRPLIVGTEAQTGSSFEELDPPTHDGGRFANAPVQVITQVGGDYQPGIGFHKRSTYGAFLHYVGGNVYQSINHVGDVATFWSTANDGPLSGLDADTVDGVHGYDTLHHVNADINSVDINDAAYTSNLFTGYAYGNGAITNAPTDIGYGSLMGFTAGSFKTQIIFGDGGNNHKMYTRTRFTGSGWSPWSQIWTSTTDGTGSGLDADLLDGANLSTDGTFASNSDAKVPSEKAVKTAIAAGVASVTSVSGNAGTATALQTARNIDGQSFNGTANITVVAPAIHAASNKATPVDADEFGGADSAASWVLKNFTWANIKATLKTYFDTLYAPLGGGWTLKKKTAVTTRASTAVFAADPDLQFAMAANTTYAIRITAVFSGNTSIGVKAELDGPASPTRVQFTTYYNRNSSVSTPAFAAHGAYNTAINLNLTGTPDYVVLHVEGIVQNGSNAGTFSLRWAQQTSNATGSSCLAGSTLEYTAM